MMHRPPPVPTVPVIVVHGRSHLEQALGRAAALGTARIALLSAPAAALFMGAAWWRALVDGAAVLHRGVLRTDLLDCEDAAGRALEALRLGCRHLVLAGDCPQGEAVRERAAGLGAAVSAVRPPALDLAAPGAVRRLDDWLGVG